MGGAKIDLFDCVLGDDLILGATNSMFLILHSLYSLFGLSFVCGFLERLIVVICVLGLTHEFTIQSYLSLDGLSISL